MEKVLRNQAATIRLTIRDSSEAPIDSEAPVTFAVTDSAGVSVFSGTATKPPSTTGIYEVTIGPGNVTAKLDTYTITWAYRLGAVDQKAETDVEVMGVYLFGVQEIRDKFADLSSTTTFPKGTIEDAREVAEDGLKDACRISFQPRGRRVYLDGNSSTDIYVPDVEVIKVVAAKVTDSQGTITTLTPATDLAVYPHGLIRMKSASPIGTWTDGDLNVEILYEYGLNVVPSRVKRAAMLWAKDVLKPRDIPDRATSFTTDEGTFELGSPGEPGFRTGIPEVDAVIEEFNRRRPASG